MTMVTFVQGAVGQTYDDGHIIVAGPSNVEDARNHFSVLSQDFRNVGERPGGAGGRTTEKS